ncbi:MAG: hypothetical protein K6F84_06825 [Lachnospiraceae bacterium]|nr:hypothetical protein [Lachnospiraceae bacterium]
MNEELFNSKIKELVKKGRDNHNLVYSADVEEFFKDILPKDKLEAVYEYLKAKNISVDEYEEEPELNSEDTDYLGLYMEELKNVEELSEAEKLRVILEVQNGDSDSTKLLIKSCLKNVTDIAKLYAGQGVLIEDLIGEGNVALTLFVSSLEQITSTEDFDADMARAVMDAMEEIIAESEECKKRDSKVEAKVNKVYDAAKKLKEDLRRNVTVDELVNESGLTQKAVLDAVRLSAGNIEEIDT